MYSLKTNSSFDSAHFLAGYEGKCRNLHGHRWTVEVEVGGEKLMQDGQTRGMVVDFGDLKKDLRERRDGSLPDYGERYIEGKNDGSTGRRTVPYHRASDASDSRESGKVFL